jgi:hypothetical protein
MLLFVQFSFGQKTDTLYFNESPRTAFNAGLNSQGRPKVVFDDINIFADDGDSIAVTRLKFGIFRPANAPATTVSFYYTSLDTSAISYGALMKVPPVLIGSVDLPVAGTSASQFYVSLGDSINPVFKVEANTGAIFDFVSTFFLGVGFSNSAGAYWLTSDSAASDDAMWIYNADSTVKTYASYFGGAPQPEASFVAQVYGYYVQKTLPVTLSGFKASAINDRVVLNWKTESESNSSHFTIEVSKNGRDFSDIGRAGAAGFSSTTKNYTFNHSKLSSGTYYYRLKMVDKDNSSKYSSVEKVTIENQPIVLKISPNPVIDNIQFTWLEDGNYQYKIIDLSGKQIVLGKVMTGNNKISMSTAAKGVYLIQVIDKNEKVISNAKILSK